LANTAVAIFGETAIDRKKQ